MKNVDSVRVPKTVVFCRTKDKACEVYLFLRSAAPHSKGSLGLYHASLTPETKSHTRAMFTNSDIRVLAATIAFEMVGPRLVKFSVFMYIGFFFGGVDREWIFLPSI